MNLPPDEKKTSLCPAPVAEKLSEQDIRLTDVDWHDLYPRLLFAARYMMRRNLRWQGSVLGLSAHDFVQQAITKTLSGQRQLHSTEISLFKHLVGVIRSDINHSTSSYEGRRVVDYDQAGEAVANVVDMSQSAEDKLEQESETQNLLNFLKKTDPKATEMVRVILANGRSSGSELASEMGVSLEEFYSIKKRLSRKLDQYLQAQASEQQSAASS